MTYSPVMTYFPQPNPDKRARRVRVPGAVGVAVRSEGSQTVRGLLHELSATGGMLVLSKALEQGDVVEVAFRTSHGIVRGMAELLSGSFFNWRQVSHCLLAPSLLLEPSRDLVRTARGCSPAFRCRSLFLVLSGVLARFISTSHGSPRAIATDAP